MKPRTDKVMRMNGPRDVVVCDLGRMEYEPAWHLQQRIQARLIQAKRSEPPRQVPHVLLFVEHPPVYTLGKSGKADHLLATDELLAARGATFHRIDRGGDITYHGPGQLVGYPILDLDRFFTDIHRYLRALEEAVIRTCADFGVTGRRVDGRTGVWVGPDDRGFERKICAMGIRCSRWVTMHGFALNVNTDLDYFSHIIPCGIGDRDVTSLSRELNGPVEMEEVQNRFVGHFGDGFGASVTSMSGRAAREYLRDFIASKELPAA